MLISGSHGGNRKREREPEFRNERKDKAIKVIDLAEEFNLLKVTNATNFFSQIKQAIPESIEFISNTKFRGLLQRTIQKIAKLFLPNRKDVIQDTKRFFYRLNLLIDLLPKNNRRNLKTHIEQIAYHSFTSVNARPVHDRLIEILSTQKRTLATFKSDIPICLRSNMMNCIIERLNQILMFQKKVKPVEKICYNLPNITFKVEFANGKMLTFLRSKNLVELENKIDISKIFRQHLDLMHMRNEQHLDLSLMSLSEWEDEKHLSELRHELQEFNPDTLFSWAFDFYSDLHWHSKESRCCDDFINDFIEHFLCNEKKIFRLPTKLNMLQNFENDLRKIIQGVHIDFFHGDEFFHKTEFEPFVLIAVIHLIEYFCEKLKTTACTTACRCHIDRGMVIMTTLFYYLQIKSGQENNPEYAKYTETMVFAPAMLYYNRPPHLSVIERLLNVLALFNKPGVIQNIQNRQTYFSAIKLLIPC